MPGVVNKAWNNLLAGPINSVSLFYTKKNLLISQAHTKLIGVNRKISKKRMKYLPF